MTWTKLVSRYLDERHYIPKTDPVEHCTGCGGSLDHHWQWFSEEGTKAVHYCANCWRTFAMPAMERARRKRIVVKAGKGG